MAQRVEPSIDARTHADIDWTIRYTESPDQDLHVLFKTWWDRRKKSPSYSKLGRDFWKAEFFRVVQMRKDATRTRSGRCPICGVKLTVVRCLACDLRALQAATTKEAKRVR